MKLFDTFFSFDGRLDPSGFFGLLSVTVLTMIGVTGLGTMLLSSGLAIAIPYALLLIGLASLAALWSVATLLTKRLHDMNLTAGHAMAVYGLNLLALGFAAYNPSLGVALTVFVLGASIWFLLTPGTAGRNRFGGLTQGGAAEPGFGRGLRIG